MVFSIVWESIGIGGYSQTFKFNAHRVLPEIPFSLGESICNFVHLYISKLLVQINIKMYVMTTDSQRTRIMVSFGRLICDLRHLKFHYNPIMIIIVRKKWDIRMQ